MGIRKRSRQREVTDPLQPLLALLPDPWSADEFVHRVAEHRGRPIQLLTYPLSSDDPTGFWLSTADTDYIVIPETAGGSRRDAIIGHELAHIVLGHDPLPANDTAGLAAVAPSSSPELVGRFLPRQGYGADIEREAETLATRLIAYVNARTTDAGTVTELDRLTSRLR